MKIKARIDVLFNREGMKINIYDDESGIEFVNLSLNQEQTCNALSRLCRVEVESCEVNYLNKIGKIQEHKLFSFKITEDDYWRDKHEVLPKLCDEAMKKEGLLEQGWVSDNYYRSQNSIYKKDGTWFAKTFIRRWVEKGEKNEA